MENETENIQKNPEDQSIKSINKDLENQSLNSSKTPQSENLLNNLLNNIISEDDAEEQKKSFFPTISKKILMVLFFLFFLFFLTFSIRNILNHNKDQKINKIFFPQPFSIMNDFFYYKLENGLKVLHIKSDQQSDDLVNLSLSVAAGNNSDFEGFKGLAKLMGQIFFDGSVNYEIDEYIKFVADKHEGSIEAVVKKYISTFHFEIEDDGLEEILEPFMDSLKHPFFDEYFLKKNIIEMNLKNEAEYFTNRNLFNYKLLKYLGKKNSKLFNDGNYLLKTDIDYGMLKTQLQKFHDKFYKANLMSLVIVSNQNKEYIKELIDKNFGNLPSNPDVKDFTDIKKEENKKQKKLFPFEQSVYEKIYFSSSQIEIPTITLNFVVDSENEFGKFQPGRFFSSLLTYEGKDSFIYDLYKNNLCNLIKSGFSYHGDNYAIVTISFSMPEDSQSKLSLIIEKLYLFIHGLKNKELHEVFYSLKHYSKLDFFFNIDNEYFNFSDKNSASLFDSSIAFSETLLFYDPHFIYIRNNLLNNFNKEKWHKFLDKLTIDKAIITMNSRDFQIKGVKREKKEEPLKTKSLKDMLMEKGLMKKKEEKNRILESSHQSHINRHPAEALREKLINLKIISPKKQKLKIENTDNSENKLEDNSILSNFTKKIEKKAKINLNLTSNLEKKVDNELAEILTDFFDKKITDLELSQNLNFDENLAYEEVKYPENIFENFKTTLMIKTRNTYDGVKFPKDFMLEYDITNSCKVPDFFKIKSLISEEQNFIFDLEDKKNIFIPQKSQPVEVKQILDINQQIVKRRNDPDLKLLKKFQILKSYKKCLFSEFQIDTKTLIMDNIINDEYIKVLKKTYRQTFQNKYVMYLEVNSSLLVQKIINEKNLDKKIQFSLTIEIFCLYFREHMNFTYSILMMQGNKFSCELKNGLFLIKLESFKNYGKKFSEIIFKELKNSNFPHFYDKLLFINIKEFNIDNYSTFRNLNLSEFLKFYMGNLCDKLSIDTSNEKKFLKIRKMIENIDIKELSSFSNSILEGAHISFIYMGDIDTEESLSKTKTYVTNLYRGDVNHEDVLPSRETISKMLFRRPNADTTVFRIMNESTQPELNAYLTYFYVGGGITKKKELYLKVILHFMEKFLIENLETKLDVEKIDVSIVNYYNNFGIMIFFTGTFVPHLVEYDIEKSFLDFSNYMKSKRINVFKIIAKGILANMKKQHESLDQMSSQLYDIYTNQCISNDLFTYDNAIIDFTSVGLIEMIEELFFKLETNKRVIFEVYNEEISEDVMHYKLKESLTLDGRSYSVYGKEAIGNRFKFFSLLRESLLNTFNLGISKK